MALALLLALSAIFRFGPVPMSYPHELTSGSPRTPRPLISRLPPHPFPILDPVL